MSQMQKSNGLAGDIPPDQLPPQLINSNGELPPQYGSIPASDLPDEMADKDSEEAAKAASDILGIPASEHIRMATEMLRRTNENPEGDETTKRIKDYYDVLGLSDVPWHLAAPEEEFELPHPPHKWKPTFDSIEPADPLKKYADKLEPHAREQSLAQMAQLFEDVKNRKVWADLPADEVKELLKPLAQQFSQERSTGAYLKELAAEIFNQITDPKDSAAKMVDLAKSAVSGIWHGLGKRAESATESFFDNLDRFDKVVHDLGDALVDQVAGALGDGNVKGDGAERVKQDISAVKQYFIDLNKAAAEARRQKSLEPLSEFLPKDVGGRQEIAGIVETPFDIARMIRSPLIGAVNLAEQALGTDKDQSKRADRLVGTIIFDRGQKEVADRLGIDRDDIGYEVANFAGQSILPGVTAKFLAGPIAKISDKAINYSIKAAAKSRIPQLALRFGRGALLAGKLHPLRAAAEILLGETGGGPSWLKGIRESLFKKGEFAEIGDVWKAAREAPADAPVAEYIDSLYKAKVEQYKGIEKWLRDNHGGEIEKVDAKIPGTNKPLFPKSELEGVDLKIREAQEKLAQLDKLRKSNLARGKVHRILSNAAKAGLGGSTISGLIGAEAGLFSAAYDPTRPEAGAQGAVTGQLLGTLFGRQVFHRGQLKNSKDFLLKHGEGAVKGSLDGVNPMHADEIKMLAALSRPAGGNIHVLAPEELIAKDIKEGNHSPGERAPNGYIQGRDLFLNRDALKKGVAGHEFTHLYQRFARDIFANLADAMGVKVGTPLYNQFEEIYRRRAKLSNKEFEGLTPQEQIDEIQAEMGRIALKDIPIEKLFSGKTLTDSAVEFLQKKFGDKSKADKVTIDPTLGAPYTPQELAEIKDIFYRIAEKSKLYYSTKGKFSVSTPEPEPKAGARGLESVPESPEAPAAASEGKVQMPLSAQQDEEFRKHLTREELRGIQAAIDRGEITSEEQMTEWVRRRIQPRSKILQAIKSLQDSEKPFEVEFYKSDGSLRKMKAQFGGGSEGAKRTADGKPHLYVLKDLEANEPRTVDIDKVVSIKGGGVEYNKPQYMPSSDLEMPYAPDGAQKAWIDPDGNFIPVQIAHAEWFLSHPEEAKKFGIADPESMDDTGDAKSEASQVGFVRITIPRGTGTAIVETNSEKWDKVKDKVRDVLGSNVDNIIRADIRLLDGRKVVSRDTAFVNRDPSKLYDMPSFQGEKNPAGSLLDRKGLAGIAVYGGDEAVFMPDTPELEAGVASVKNGEKSGATFDIQGRPITKDIKGDVVTISSHTIPIGELTTDKIREFVGPFDNIKGIYPGIWNSRDGNATIDINLVRPVGDRAKSLEIARINGQQAIYNFDSAEEIPTDGSRKYMPPTPDTPQFRQWFGDSKVVDEEGKPKVVYHGTVSDFNAFQRKFLGSGRGASTFHADSKMGFFFSEDPSSATWFANASALKSKFPGATFDDSSFRIINFATDNPEQAVSSMPELLPSGARVIPAYLSLKNPVLVKNPEAWEALYYSGKRDVARVIKMMKAAGHDGIELDFPPSEEAERTHFLGTDKKHYKAYIAFDSKQIKSAIANKGTFNPKSPNIMMMPPDEAVNSVLNEKDKVLASIDPGEREAALTYFQRLAAQMQNRLTDEERGGQVPVSPNGHRELLDTFKAIHKLVESTGEPREFLVIGAGPAGTSAAAYAAFDGIDVVVMEKASEPGGQSKESAEIRNASPDENVRVGRERAAAAFRSAQVNGAQFRLGTSVTKIEKNPTDGLFEVESSDSAGNKKVEKFRKIMVSPGLEWADHPELAGTGFGRGARLAEKSAGKFAVVYGGGNSATQAVHGAIAAGAKKVFLVVRRKLEASSNQVVRLRELPNVEIIEGASIKKIFHEHGGNRPVAVLLSNNRMLPAQWVESFLDSKPKTGFLPNHVLIQRGPRKGFVKVANDKLETPEKGMYVAGDVRNGERQRTILTAQGEGVAVARNVNEKLREEFESGEFTNTWRKTRKSLEVGQPARKAESQLLPPHPTQTNTSGGAPTTTSTTLRGRTSNTPSGNSLTPERYSDVWLGAQGLNRQQLPPRVLMPKPEVEPSDITAKPLIIDHPAVRAAKTATGFAVSNAPQQPQQQGNPQPQQQGNPRAIKEQAVRLPDGTVFTGTMHVDAIARALESKGRVEGIDGIDDLYDVADKILGDYETGSVTNEGEFLDRFSAAQRATEVGQANRFPSVERYNDRSGVMESVPFMEAGAFENERKFMPADDSEVRAALSEDKKEKVGLHRQLPEGSQVGVRIDIPAYNRSGTYVQTVHGLSGQGGIGKVLGYDHSVAVDNPQFHSNEKGAMKIRDGSPKFPVATVNGEYRHTLPRGYENWTKVGFNPKNHSYFYDKENGQPVVSGDRAVSQGNTVYVENPVYAGKNEFAYMPDTEDPIQGLDQQFFQHIWPELMKGRASGNLKVASRRAAEDVSKFIQSNPRFTQYYKEDLQKTKAILDRHYGQPITDDEFKSFLVFKGMTSSDTLLPANVTDALAAFDYYRNNGSFKGLSLSPKEGTGNLVIKGDSPFPISGRTRNIKARSMIAFDYLANKMGGPGKAISFLEQPATVTEINALNRELGYKGNITKLPYVRKIVKSATGQDELIPRMFVLGPKVGAYTMSLLGHSEYTTIDKWESRFIRSYIKGGFDKNIDYPQGAEEQKLFSKFSAAFNKHFREITGENWPNSALQSARWFYILDAAKKAGYKNAATNDTISNYVQASLDRRGNNNGRGPGRRRTALLPSRFEGAAGRKPEPVSP